MTGLEVPDPTPEIAELARLRQGLYRFFGASFLYPDADRVHNLRSAASILDAQSLESFAFFGAWADFRQVLELGHDQLELEAEYVRLFSASIDGVLCPPNEAPYVGLRSGSSGQLLADLAREYGGYGIALAAGKGELPDHASVQFEVMSYLCGREASAWDEGCLDAVSVSMSDERTFLEDHLGRWFRLFAERISNVARGSFYAAAARVADAFVQHEMDLLSVLQAATSGGTGNG